MLLIAYIPHCPWNIAFSLNASPFYRQSNTPHALHWHPAIYCVQWLAFSTACAIVQLVVSKEVHISNIDRYIDNEFLNTKNGAIHTITRIHTELAARIFSMPAESYPYIQPTVLHSPSSSNISSSPLLNPILTYHSSIFNSLPLVDQHVIWIHRLVILFYPITWE